MVASVHANDLCVIETTIFLEIVVHSLRGKAHRKPLALFLLSSQDIIYESLQPKFKIMQQRTT